MMKWKAERQTPPSDSPDWQLDCQTPKSARKPSRSSAKGQSAQEGCLPPACVPITNGRAYVRIVVPGEQWTPLNGASILKPHLNV